MKQTARDIYAAACDGYINIDLTIILRIYISEVESIATLLLLDEDDNNIIGVVLDVFQEEVMTREIEFASHDIKEAVRLFLHPPRA